MEKSERFSLGAAVHPSRKRSSGLLDLVNRHTLHKQRNRQFSAAVRPRRDKVRSPLNLLNRQHAVGQKPNQNANPVRHAAIAMPPSPHRPWANVEQRRNTLLRYAKHAERFVKLSRGHVPVSICPDST
jgi:hypothetical protein